MRGFGRWIYCKHCYQNVYPDLSGLDWQIRCPKCGYGLTPCFNNGKELKAWLRGE